MWEAGKGRFGCKLAIVCWVMGWFVRVAWKGMGWIQTIRIIWFVGIQRHYKFYVFSFMEVNQAWKSSMNCLWGDGVPGMLC